MNETGLSQAVEGLAEVMQALPDETLGEDWTWRDHDEGVRFALLGTYHELRDLAVSLTAGRISAGIPITAAQHALAQYHAAYRDLQAVLLGVSDDQLDRPPAEGEWPLRTVLGHIIAADRRFFSLVYYAVQQQRANEEPTQISAEAQESLVGPRQAFEATLDNEGLAAILEFYSGLHSQILHQMAGLTDRERNARSLFWEDEALPVYYRLHRFDAHLRQHTVQAEKTLAAIGRAPNEARRLLRLVYNALAEAEGAVIGVWDFGVEPRREAAAVISRRAAEIADLVGN